MEIADKIILVTGANRGIGRALVEEAVPAPHSLLLDLKSRRFLADAVVPRLSCRPRRERTRRPYPMSASMADSWHSGAVKAMERQNAAFVA
jgi:NAD(P)-dependent dehydrogenase (short-subunit alcohol dehydrogenase family)